MKNYISSWALVLLTLIFFSAAIDYATPHGFLFGYSASYSTNVIVPGTHAPQSQTANMPSTETEGPSCLDSSWGECDNTQHCVAPTSSAPFQHCQPPQQLYPLGGTGDGTVATINYHSATNYAYPPTAPLIISGALQSNWNTPNVQIDPSGGITSTATDSNCSGGPSVTVSLLGGSNPFLAQKQIYVSGLAVVFAQQNIFGDGKDPKSMSPNGRFFVGAISGQTVDYCTINQVLGKSTITNHGSVFPGNYGTYTNVPLTGGHGTGAFGTVTTSMGSGVGTFIITTQGTGYQVNDVLTPNYTSTTLPWCNLTTNPSGCTLPTFTIGSPTIASNQDGFAGKIIQPFIVSASGCSNQTCYMTFSNPYSCSSSCVTNGTGTATQIVAGQNDDLILAWNFGEQIPYSTFTGGTTIKSCVLSKSLGPITVVAAESDGGTFTTTSVPETSDPKGVGLSQLQATSVKSEYCYQVAASAYSADGQHSIRVIACGVVGYCGQLTSVISMDGNSSSPYWKSNNHGLGDTKALGITYGPPGSPTLDAQFPAYDSRYTSTLLNNQEAISASGATANGTNIIVSHASTQKYVAGETVGINSLTTTNNSCNISNVTTSASGSLTNSSITTGALTISLAGTCNFPTGSLVNISGITTLNSCTITGVTISAGVATLSYSGNCIFYSGTAYNINTGTYQVGVPPSINAYVQLTSASAGQVQFNTTVTSVTLGTSPTIASNGYSMNGSEVIVSSGANCSSTCSIVVPGLSTATYLSGTATVTADGNQICQIASSPAPTSTTFACPNLASNGTTFSGGNITSSGNTFFVVGGKGDNPAPYTPYNPGLHASPFTSHLTGDSFELLPLVYNYGQGLFVPQLQSNGSPAQNSTGCAADPCGRVPASTNVTAWGWRRSAGVLEKNNPTPPSPNNGTYFFYTNVNHTIQTTRAHVDSWNTSSSTAVTGNVCNETPTWAGAPLSSYSGPYCASINLAMQSLTATISKANGTSGNVTQTLGNDGNGCVTFTSTSNSVAPVLHVGQTIELATNVFDNNTTPQLSQWANYWIQSITGNTVTLANKPGAGVACIAESISNFSVTTAQLQSDLSFFSILLECNVSLGCSNSNPETYAAGVTVINNGGIVGNNTLYFAAAGWFNIDPNTANGASAQNTSLVMGTGNLFTGGTDQNGRLRYSIQSVDNGLSLTSSVTVGPTLPTITSTSANVSLLTCPGSAPVNTHQCEKITFAAHLNPATQIADGAAFQAPTTSGGPGQGIVVSGLTSTGGTFNCPSPCDGNVDSNGNGIVGIVASTPTSVTFINDTASGTASGTATITPQNIILEFPAGTFAYDSTNDPNGECAPNNIAFIPESAAAACFSNLNGIISGTAPNEYPFTYSGNNYGFNTQLMNSSNCLPIETWNGAKQITLQSVKWAAKSPSTSNDIVTLWSGTSGVQAYNQCGATGNGPFVFANPTTYIVNAGVDVWEDTVSFTGPFWGSTLWGGTNTPSFTGSRYLTSNSSFNTDVSLDISSYAFGSISQNNHGSCINQVAVVVSINCLGAGAHVIPIQYGGYCEANPCVTETSAQTLQIPILGSLDASGNQLTGITTATKTLQVAQGSISSTVVPGYTIWVSCNITTNNSALAGTEIYVTTATYINNNSNPALITLASTPPSSCNSNPVVWTDNSTHIDFSFWIHDGDLAPGAPTGLGSYTFWLHTKDVVEENVWCFCGRVEGIFIQGGNLLNVDIEDGSLNLNQAPIPTQAGALGGLALGGGSLVYNLIIRNQTIASPDAQQVNNVLVSWADTFYLNINGGVNTNWPLGSFDPLGTGFGAGSFTVMNNPFQGSTTLGGAQTNVAVWPSFTLSVNGSGNPSVVGLPTVNSLFALPWYLPQGVSGAFEDTGLGSW